MKTFFAAPILTLALSTIAFAKQDFSGPYAGVGLALGIGHNDFSQSTRANQNGMALSNSSSNLSPVGVIGGGHVGWNKQLDNKYLIGIEAWVDASTVDDTIKESEGNLVDMSSKDQMDWSVGVAAKAGLLVDKGLLYLSVGWVGSQWKTKTSVTATQMLTDPNPSVSQTFKEKKFASGVRPAIGFSWPINKKLFVTGEGAYTFYQSNKGNHGFSFNVDDGMGNKMTVPTTVRTKSQPQVAELRVKLSWRLFQ